MKVACVRRLEVKDGDSVAFEVQRVYLRWLPKTADSEWRGPHMMSRIDILTRGVRHEGGSSKVTTGSWAMYKKF